MDPLKKPGDVFFEMVDLDKGVLGKDYTVSLFLHVSSSFALLKPDLKDFCFYEKLSVMIGCCKSCYILTESEITQK